MCDPVRTDTHLPHRPIPHHSGETTGVVIMEVGQQDIRNARDAEVIQAGVHLHRIRSGVDHHAGTRAGP
jgi:hypothetical protein